MRLYDKKSFCCLSVALEVPRIQSGNSSAFFSLITISPHLSIFYLYSSKKYCFNTFIGKNCITVAIIFYSHDQKLDYQVSNFRFRLSRLLISILGSLLYFDFVFDVIFRLKRLVNYGFLAELWHVFLTSLDRNINRKPSPGRALNLVSSCTVHFNSGADLGFFRGGEAGFSKIFVDIFFRTTELVFELSLSVFSPYFGQMFCAAGKILKKQSRKSIFRHFLEIFDKKMRFFGARSPLANLVDFWAPLEKFLGCSAKTGFLKSTKGGDPLGR